MREVCAALGTTSTNGANDHRRYLVRKGLLRWEEDGTARTQFLPTDAGWMAAGYSPLERGRSLTFGELHPLGFTYRHGEALRNIKPGETAWIVDNTRTRVVGPGVDFVARAK